MSDQWTPERQFSSCNDKRCYRPDHLGTRELNNLSRLPCTILKWYDFYYCPHHPVCLGYSVDGTTVVDSPKSPVDSSDE